MAESTCLWKLCILFSCHIVKTLVFFPHFLFWLRYTKKIDARLHELSDYREHVLEDLAPYVQLPRSENNTVNIRELLQQLQRIRDFGKLQQILKELNITPRGKKIYLFCIPSLVVLTVVVGLAAAYGTNYTGYTVVVGPDQTQDQTSTGQQWRSHRRRKPTIPEQRDYPLSDTTEPITFSAKPVPSHGTHQTPGQTSTEQQLRSRRRNEHTSSEQTNGDGTTQPVQAFSSSTSENATATVTVTLPSVDVKYLPGNVSRLIVPRIPTMPSPTHPPEVAASCAIGSCSYDEFRLPVPRNVHSCTSIVSIPISPSGRNSSKMNYIKCDTDCGYYSVNLKDFSYSILFEEKIPEVGTMTIDTTWSHYCDEVEIPTSSYNTSFPDLKWLELKVPYECSEVYKIVSTFNTSLDLLSFQRPVVSTRNHRYIKKILRSNSKIRTLIMTNVTFCTHCDIFEGIYFENLEVVELHFGNQTNFDRAIAQLEILISNCPRLKKITINFKISVSTLETISKHPNNLERARIFVTVDFNNGNPYFSLESLTGFTNLEILNLYINAVTSASLNNTPSTSIKIIGFEKLSSSSLKRLFIKSSHRLIFDSKAERFCSFEFGRHKYSLTCKRG